MLTMKIALAQIKVNGDVEKNYIKALNYIKEASKQNAALILFPELQLYPFFPQHSNKKVDEYALTMEHKYIKGFAKQCKSCEITGIFNVYLEENGKKYDASPVYSSKGELLGISKMVHIVQKKCFFEQDYYTPSDSGFKVYDIGICKIGVVICFDRHYPESIRSCVLNGADLIAIPTANIIGENLELFEWELKIPAVQNGVFISMCNRVGTEGKIKFCGESLVVDPNGNTVIKVNNKEQLILIDIDLNLIHESRNNRQYLNLRNKKACQL